MTTHPQLNTDFVPAFVQAREHYWLAKALNDTNVEIDAAAKQETLQEHVFLSYQHTKTGTEVCRRLTDHKQDYTLKDDEFRRYLKLVHTKRVEKGLRLPYHKYAHAIDEPWNLTPDCETRELLRAAEHAFILASLDLLPEPLKTDLAKIGDLQNYVLCQKFIELSLRLDVGEVPTAKQLLQRFMEATA